MSKPLKSKGYRPKSHHQGSFHHHFPDDDFKLKMFGF